MVEDSSTEIMRLEDAIETNYHSLKLFFVASYSSDGRLSRELVPCSESVVVTFPAWGDCLATCTDSVFYVGDSGCCGRSAG
jgi:hypothetical protein